MKASPTPILYKLKNGRTTIMIAEFVTEHNETVVHGQGLKKGYAKFLIVSVFLRSVMKWSPYDSA